MAWPLYTYSSPAVFRRPVAPIDETRPVSNAYSAAAVFRSPDVEPGKFTSLKMAAAGSKFV